MKKESKTERLEIVHGTGNVFRDLGVENADREQFKAILAAEIIRTLDRDGLSVRKAQSLTGVAAADFSRIRNAGPEPLHDRPADDDRQPPGLAHAMVR